jgi:hypothetical protein
MAPAKINPVILKAQVEEEGLKLEALAEHYNLSANQMRAALKQLNLKIRKFHHPKFVFVYTDEENTHAPAVIISEETPVSAEMDVASNFSEVEEVEKFQVEREETEQETETMEAAVAEIPEGDNKEIESWTL